MLKELFESIVSQAHESKDPEQPRVFDAITQSDQRRVAYVYKGELHEVVLQTPPRAHVATSARDFVELIERCKTEEPLILFVEISRVTAILDDERLNTIELPLTLSQHFQLLQKMPAKLDQRKSIELLRRTFHGTGLDHFATNIRSVVFERSQSAAGTAKREQESMGRSVESRVTGTADLPEMLSGHISVFLPSVFRTTTAIELGVDPLLTEETFEFWLPPDALTEWHNEAIGQLIEMLSAELPDATIVRGSVGPSRA